MTAGHDRTSPTMHNDPLVAVAAKALHEAHQDECCPRGQRDAAAVVAALRPHIDAEKRAAVHDSLLHQPVIAPRIDGTFGVFCAACSHEAEEYVYRCKARPEWNYPSILVAAGDDRPPTYAEPVAARVMFGEKQCNASLRYRRHPDWYHNCDLPMDHTGMHLERSWFHEDQRQGKLPVVTRWGEWETTTTGYARPPADPAGGAE